MKRITALAALLMTAAITLTGCRAQEEKRVFTGFYFDTVVNITLFSGEDGLAEDAFRLCGELEDKLSKTDVDSLVYELNKEGCTRADRELCELIELSRDMHRMTEGAFDITLEAVSELWDFKNGVIPTDKSIEEASKKTGIENITVYKDRITAARGVKADLGGIAKGYAADRIAELLTAAGADGIADVGGDIAVTDGSKRRIAVYDPKTGETGCVILTDKAVVTSGTYERCFISDGVRYHHILDPKTGMPADSGLVSATVIAESAARADALSTAAIVLGEEKTLELINSTENTEALLIRDSGEIIYSDGAEALING